MSNLKLILILFAITFFASCEKDKEPVKVETTPSLAVPQDPQVLEAYNFYQKSNPVSIRSNGRDTVDVFHAFNLNWAAARSGLKDNQFPFIIVPLALESDSKLWGDMIFYKGSCGLSMELWWFPKTNTFAGGKHESLLNGKVCIMNDCHQYTQMFAVENGTIVFADTTAIKPLIQPDVQSRNYDPKCPRWGKTIWDNLLSFMNSISEGLTNFFGGLSGGGNTSTFGIGWNFTWAWWSGLGNWNLPNGSSNSSGNGNGNGDGNNGDGTNPAYNPPVHPALTQPTGQNGPSCLMLQLEYFKYLYGVDLLNDYEDIAYGCFNGSCTYDINEVCAIDALNALAEPDEDGLVDILDPGNGKYTGPTASIPHCIQLADGTQITVEFGITSDGKSADAKVAVCLINALVHGLQCAHDAGFYIQSIFINSTTNGKHSSKKSNHFNSLAIDISRINGIRMIDMSPMQLQTVAGLQNCLQGFDGIRENFGPSVKLKLGLPYNVKGHKDHVHFSINANTTCNDFKVDDHKCK